MSEDKSRFWRLRASEVRAIAANCTTAPARVALKGAARHYEYLAEREERHQEKERKEML